MALSFLDLPSCDSVATTALVFMLVPFRLRL
jgi:hypothetical protein